MAVAWSGDTWRAGPIEGGPMADGPLRNEVVFDYTAILSGRTWYGEGESNHPVILTYSFNTAAQPYLSEVGFTDDFIASFGAFSEADKTLARSAIAQWADASGIIAIEAPAGQGDIQFGRFDFDEEPVMTGFDGYAFYPSVFLSETSVIENAFGGDVFIDSGSSLYAWLALHEFGHALGFKHPFDDTPTLPPSLDRTSNTIMSYTGPAFGTLGPFDLQAVKFLYGEANTDGTHVASWSWDAATATLTQRGTANSETIRGVYGRDVISGVGGNDLLFGSFGDDKLSGVGGQDSLFGWDGDDLLNGGSRSDRLDGGAGADSFKFAKALHSSGVNRDTIVGFDALDADTIDIPGKVRAIEETIATGQLSAATFNPDLAAALDGGFHKRNAVLFTPDGGDLAGTTILIVDLNRTTGYQSGADLVLVLDEAVNLGSLDLLDFT